MNQVSPEMSRLITVFEGSYAIVEHHRPHQGFPNGGTRTGTAMFRSAAGGAAMVEEVSSGDVLWTGIFWWDRTAKLYHTIMCANVFPQGCLTGGTAQWKGSNLVGTWEGEEDGVRTKFRDLFADITSNSFTLVAEQSADGAPLKELVCTTYTRTGHSK
jgi:hypothetical protein